MRNLISFMHISLDGFVAGANGEMNWITIEQEIFDRVENRINLTDTAMYGKNTFQMMESYWPTAADKPNATKHDVEHSKWYKHAKKIVLSTTLKEEGFANTKVINSNFVDQLKAIKQQEGSEILVFGSPRATHSLLQNNLIDGFWLFVNPIILGKGIPLFKDIDHQMRLKQVSSHSFNCGVTELNYLIQP